MLTNNEGLKIAVIVNDVASVNIDSKLVRGGTTASTDDELQTSNNNSDNTSLPAGIVELQNGCACCSMSGELLSSVSELLTISDMRQNEEERFDHIVIEMSGVAEPRSVRNIFQEAMMYDMPLMERIRLDTLVTVVDCSTYVQYLKSSRLATVDEAPELYYRNEQDKIKAEKEEDESWMEGIPSIGSDQGGFEGGVCDLLVEQTEVADVVLLNKIDIAQGELEDTKQIVTALNPRAKVIATSFGKVKRLNDILAVSKGEGVAIDGVVDDHKDYVTAVDEATNCSDPDCTDPTHAHSHEHSHGHEHSQNTHSFDKNQADNMADCTDPDCTDTTHSHSHSHASSETATQHSNISSFVYRARRPFHPLRLLSVLQKLPVVRGVPADQIESIDDLDENEKKVFQQVIRSKGFAWTADSNVKALYWSHSGCSFEMQCLGRWWATLPKSQWPEEAKESILADFDSIDHDESAASISSSTVGDRRQEIVFIGPGIGSTDSQAVIKGKLDSCLLNDEEWDLFRKNRSDEASLTCFANPLQERMLTY